MSIENLTNCDFSNNSILNKYNQLLKEDIYYIDKNKFKYCKYPGEILIKDIINLMSDNLSEPYPILTYRYFLDTWPDLCITVFDKDDIFAGSLVAGIEETQKGKTKGYIAMIAVVNKYRGKRIAKNIIDLFVEKIKNKYKLKEIFLETEVDNTSALALYESCGFIKDRINSNYYLNGKSAFRLKYYLTNNADLELVNKFNESNILDKSVVSTNL